MVEHEVDHQAEARADREQVVPRAVLLGDRLAVAHREAVVARVRVERQDVHRADRVGEVRLGERAERLQRRHPVAPQVVGVGDEDRVGLGEPAHARRARLLGEQREDAARRPLAVRWP